MMNLKKELWSQKSESPESNFCKCGSLLRAVPIVGRRAALLFFVPFASFCSKNGSTILIGGLFQQKSTPPKR
jgi:hypothetical protein